VATTLTRPGATGGEDPVIIYRHQHARTSYHNIPSEIQNQIFEYLKREYSVCLGLTCEEFYGIHRSYWGKIDLIKPVEFWTHQRQTQAERPICLYHLLKDWSGSTMFFYYKRIDPKFVTITRIAELNAERWAVDREDRIDYYYSATSPETWHYNALAAHGWNIFDDFGSWNWWG
jgi:hypothetical protein